MPSSDSIVIVPPSWLRTRSRTIESPRLRVTSTSKPSGRPQPLSRRRPATGRDAHEERARRRRRLPPTTGDPRLGEGILHRVWSSSATATASGVAMAAATSPSPPSTSIVTGKEMVFVSRIMFTRAATISSKGTCSVESREGCRGRGRSPGSAFRLQQRGAAGRLGVVQTARLETQERRDRLQVVLDPVVHLTNRRVLRQQEPVPAPKVGHVPQQDGRARHLPPRDERDAADHQHDVRAPLDLLDSRELVRRTPRRQQRSRARAQAGWSPRWRM